MAKVCPLFSGSSGNSTYIGSAAGNILIDAGASFKGISKALDNIGESPEKISAVAITHSHNDHIKGIKTLLNKTGAELIATRDTIDSLIKLEKIPAETRIRIIEDELLVDDLKIKAFATSHDCSGSCGYNVFLPDGKKISICTDLGFVSEDVRKAISGSNAILLESNHDIDMLKSGPYPPDLKLRILSDKGHISNISCAAELKGLIESGTTRFILGHLSLHNNTPLLAKSSAEAALIDAGAVVGRDCILSVAAPKDNGVMII